MRLDLSELVQYQDELDQRIHSLHDQTRASTRSKRILALMVEIAELANETRSFKYWSVRGANEKHVLLEEFIDTIHFTLSLGLDLKQTSCQVEIKDQSAELSQLFIAWLQACAAFETQFDVEHYHAVLAFIPKMATALEFSEEDIMHAYRLKNEKNHQRQNEAY